MINALSLIQPVAFAANMFRSTAKPKIPLTNALTKAARVMMAARASVLTSAPIRNVLTVNAVWSNGGTPKMTSTDPSNKTDILISGAGIPGLTAALLLADKGLNITVLDPFPLPELKGIKAGNHTTALMNNAIEMLIKTGAWDDCAPHIAPLEILRIIDDSDTQQAPITADFNAEEIDQPQFGLNTPNNVLRAALGQKAQQHKNICLLQTKLTALEQTQSAAIATLENGDIISANLIIGADGRRSKVRAEAEINFKEKDYGQKAIICRLNHSLPHHNISTEFHRPSGPFTLVPLPNNQSSLVWVDDEDAIDAFMALDKDTFRQAIQDRSNNILGEITLQSTPEAWPLQMLQADRLTAPRVVLIAEAAHVLHPLGAQGLNLSLRDAEVLVQTITEALMLGLDYGSDTILEKYETARRHDIQNRIWGTDGLTQLLCTDSFFIKTLRRRGLKAVSRITPLKRLLMNEGLAPSSSAA
jgi:2-octaprenyl-6-methoxyphenol hydroxylase